MKKEISNGVNQNKQAIVGFIGVLTLLAIVFAISTGVDIFNKIKQSRYIGQDVNFKNTIVVSDTGEIYAKPDLAIISFSVVNEAKEVSDAMLENTEKMNNVINALKDQGIAEKDLKTTSYNIYPRYDYIKTETISGKRVLAGYEVRQALQVKVRSLDKIGIIISKATESGSNQIGNLQFTIDDQEELKKRAREQAVEKAKEKAGQMAHQLGVRLGKITSFSENFYSPYFDNRNIYLKEAVGMGGADSAPAPSVEAGENMISVSVTITYEIY